MSHLDQAFIRAFAKDASRTAHETIPAPTANPGPSPVVVTSPPPRSGSSASTDPLAAFHTTYIVDELCPAGTWHRVEAPVGQQSELVISQVPPPHFEFPPESPAAPMVLVSSPAEEVLRPIETTRIDESQGRGLPAPHFGFKSKKPLPPLPSLSGNESPAGGEPDARHEAIVSTVPAESPGANPATASPTAINTVASDLRVERELRVLAPPLSKPKFTPVWEVDRLQWPALCDQAVQAASEYFRDVGVRLRAAAHDGMRVLAVTSFHPGEGRTLVALSLARCAAAAGAHVALVDADLTAPQLAKALGLDASCGWEDVVAGDLPLAEAAVASLDDRIVLLPLSDDARKRTFTLSDSRVSHLLREVAEQFDLVIIDAPSLDSAEHRLFESGLACPIDAAIVVRDVRHTTEEQTLTTAARLRASGVHSVGVVENFVKGEVRG